jgi:hypothetical protein
MRAWSWFILWIKRPVADSCEDGNYSRRGIRLEAKELLFSEEGLSLKVLST